MGLPDLVHLVLVSHRVLFHFHIRLSWRVQVSRPHRRARLLAHVGDGIFLTEGVRGGTYPVVRIGQDVVDPLRWRLLLASRHDAVSLVLSNGRLALVQR